MVLPSSYKKDLEKYANKIFIVRAPIVLKNTAANGVYGEVVNGKYVEADLSAYDIYGMRLEDLARHSEDGYRIYLYQRKDLEILFTTLEKLVEIITKLKSRMNIRFTPEMDEKLSSITRLGEGILNINRSKLTTNISMNDMMSEFGFVSTNEIKEKMKYRQRVGVKASTLNALKRKNNGHL
jgi:hypothetical protein